MRRLISLAFVVLLVAASASATYVVVLKDGTRYKAKDKWKIVNGQAVVELETGSSIQFDPALIDEPETKKVNELGLGDAKLLNVEQPQPQSSSRRPTQTPLGAVTSIRPVSPSRPSVPTGDLDRDSEAQGPARLNSEVAKKFEVAYDNVGLYDAKVEPRSGYTLRVQLTADNEDDVFKAIGATSYVMLNIPDTRIDMVELLMATINGGSAGRFQMTRADAEALVKKTVSWQTYYVQHVIF